MMEFFTPTDVKKILVLPSKKAPGADGISNAALSCMPHQLIAAMVRLFNAVLRIGHFYLEESQINMLPKQEKNVILPDNSYRPITLLLALATVLEKLILSHFDSRPE